MTRNFQSALHHITTVSQQAKEAGNAEWWRPLEAGLAAVGSQSETILECIEDEDLPDFLHTEGHERENTPDGVCRDKDIARFCYGEKRR